MGGSTYSSDIYSSRIKDATDSGKDLFTHDADIKAGRVATKVHEKLDPSKPNLAGKIVRESRDSDAHPESVAVAVLFDETGSMGNVPRRFVQKLDKLMSALVKKGFLEHPHVLFGGVGDATTDKAPLQIGQFEGGNEMDEALSLIYLEGNGGGQTTESYELAMYFLARHAEMDCLEKRGKKGYCFLIGDETPYSAVKKSEVKRLIGDSFEADIPLTDILEELRSKFEVFWIRPAEGSYTHDKTLTSKMQKIFGQNWLNLERAEDIVELIASTIGVNEGFDIHDVAGHLRDIGADAASIGRVSTSLVAYAAQANANALSRGSVTDGALVSGGGDSVERL